MRKIITFVLAGCAAVALPLVLTSVVRHVLGRTVTDENAQTVFTEFQSAINQGDIIHDRVTAAAVAEQAYRNKTNAILLDGWGRRMHIYAVVQGSTCELHIQSAGPDGNFGNGDDLDLSRTFDLVPGKDAAGKAKLEPPAHQGESE